MNLVDILTNAPIGTKLYDLSRGKEVKLIKVCDDKIYAKSTNDYISYHGNGEIFEDGECVLFPSKNHKSWYKWQDILFKSGDVVYDCNGDRFYLVLPNMCILDNGVSFINGNGSYGTNVRYADAIEKNVFFDMLKKHGYEWNASEKTLCQSTDDGTTIKCFEAAKEQVEEMDELNDLILDAYYLNVLQGQNEFYKQFIKYLSEDKIGDICGILECVAENLTNEFVGYIKVTKEINDKQQVVLNFNIKEKEYSAIWDTPSNYACWQRTYGEDSYYGYLLFPTYKDDEYFCMYYEC